MTPRWTTLAMLVLLTGCASGAGVDRTDSGVGAGGPAASPGSPAPGGADRPAPGGADRPAGQVTVAVLPDRQLFVSFYDKPAGDAPCGARWSATADETAQEVVVVLTDAAAPGSPSDGPVACVEMAQSWSFTVQLSRDPGRRPVRLSDARTLDTFDAAVLAPPAGLVLSQATAVPGGGCLTWSGAADSVSLCSSTEPGTLDANTAGYTDAGAFDTGDVTGSVLTQGSDVALRWGEGPRAFVLNASGSDGGLTRDEAVRLVDTVRAPG